LSSLHRRDLMLGAAALASMAGQAQGEPRGQAGSAETIPLWPDKPPGAPGPSGVEQVTPFGSVGNVIVPRMVMQRPVKPNGAAVLILGGGGYRRISIAKEVQPTAAWLLDYGVTTFTLYYRLPNAGWPLAAPFQDAQRAMRLIRARAGSLGLDESQIGIIGYSAGGHCAGMTSVRPDATLYPPIDRSDQVSARPDFAGLIYPVLTMMPPNRTKVSTLTLLGSNPTPAQSLAMSVEQHVTDDAPTTFLAHATDDPIAPVENSLMMFAALRRAHVPVEMHVFRSGGHGFTLGQPGSDDQAWPKLFATWAGFAKS
jgi:acetyl esterase/lipase